MKKSRFIIQLNLLVGALFIITFSTGLPGQAKPTDEETEQLRSSKTVQIVLEASYGSAKNISLPVKETVEKLLPATGLKHVMSNADITLKVEIKGRAISRYYSGGGKGQIGYTGASVSGTIYLKRGDKRFFKKSFSGSVSPSFSIFKESYKTPSSAPFKGAFSRSSFTIKIMEIFREIKGNDLIYAYMGNKDRQIRKQAAILLGNLKINDTAAVNSLMAALKDEFYDVRVEAVQALEKIKDPLCIDPLINLLSDENQRVRTAVRKALNKIDQNWKERKSCQDLIPSFLSALKNKKYGIREGAVEFLAEIPDQQALKPLMMILMDKSTSIAKKAVKALDKNYPNWRTGEPAAELVLHFIGSLKSPSSDTRKGAIFALEEIEDPRALEPLINALKDTNTNVQAAALRTLDKKYQDWGSSNAARKLIPYYARALQSTSVSTRTFAVKVLAKIKEPQAVQPLIRAIKDKSVRVKEVAVKALAESDNPAVVKPLIGVIDDKSTTVRAAVVKALGMLNTPEAVEIEPLINAMQDKVSTVRKSAVESLGQKKDDRVIEPLVAALKDTSTSVQAAAAKVLGERKESRAVQPLIDLLKSRDRKVRTSANQALEKLGDFLPVESLIELLNDKDYKLRSSARDLLIKTKNPAAVEVLIASLKSEDINVRKEIIYILGRCNDNRAVEPLIEILTSKDKLEKKRAAEALKLITGEDYGVKYKKWEKWWGKNKNKK